MANYPSAILDPSSPHKRKRRLEGADDDDRPTRDTKKRTTASLPIRSSTMSGGWPSLSVTPSFSIFSSSSTQPPTPVDTSDDEGVCLPDFDGTYFNEMPPLSDSPSSSGSSASSITTQIGERGGDNDDDDDDDDDDDNDSMDDVVMSSSSPSQPRTGRARSNDIVWPRRRPSLLSPMAVVSGDRVPTPISSHFDSRIADLSSVVRHQYPPLRTNLSPMIEQESWVGRDGLPGPAEDEDVDAMMIVEQTNDTLGGHSVRGEDEALKAAPAGTSSQEHTRTARLHMGFLNGCDKCIQKVPGHYSHILWT